LTSEKVGAIFEIGGEGQNPPAEQEEKDLEIPLLRKECLCL
jgi:hypothetical protein